MQRNCTKLCLIVHFISVQVSRLMKTPKKEIQIMPLCVQTQAFLFINPKSGGITNLDFINSSTYRYWKTYRSLLNRYDLGRNQERYVEKSKWHTCPIHLRKYIMCTKNCIYHLSQRSNLESLALTFTRLKKMKRLNFAP